MALPGLSATTAGLVVAVALVETARLLASGGKAAGLAVLVDGVDDPVDARVAANRLVLRVDQDNLVVLVGRVLVDPVRVQDTEVGAAATNTLLSGSLERALVLELVDTLVGGLAYATEIKSASHSDSLIRNCARLSVCGGWGVLTISGTLGSRALAATTADTHAVDDIALLGLVAEAAGLVGTAGPRGAVDDVQLAELY